MRQSTDTINIHLNGELITIGTPCTVAELLRQRELDRTPCAVEVNRQLVPKPTHADHMLQDHDRIEIVTFVGGG